MTEKEKMKYFPVEKIRIFLLAALKSVKVRDDIAESVARGLLSASIRGVDSHGIRLLPHYIAAVEEGRINPDPVFNFQHTVSAAGTFDADHSFGHAAGIEAMHKAIGIAEESGIGAVTVYNSSHCGTSAFFALEAAEKNHIGLAFTHANALLNTPGSTRSFFGLNPIAMAVPCEDEQPFCYDSAPSVITWNRLLQIQQGGLELPPLSGADDKGFSTSNPFDITQLLPIGGYKGFGLAMIVDILCGILTGAPVGRDIPDMYKTPLSQKRNLGQFYMAINIEAFQPLNIFKKRMKKMMDDIRNEPGREPDVPVMVPGDPEKLNSIERSERGIPVNEHDLEAFKKLADAGKINFFG